MALIVSQRYKFVFIHIYKVAGTSIASALAKYAYDSTLEYYIYSAGLKLGLKRIFPKLREGNPLPDHIRAKELSNYMTEKEVNDYYKFAFVRNPWDWQVSLYHFTLDTPEHFQHDLIKSLNGFTDYIKWRVENEVRLQKDFVTDENGQLIVDFVGKFEKLTEDFERVCDILGIKAKLPNKNKSSHEHYRSYYNSETIELVARAFKEDIDFFGYCF